MAGKVKILIFVSIQILSLFGRLESYGLLLIIQFAVVLAVIIRFLGFFQKHLTNSFYSDNK